VGISPYTKYVRSMVEHGERRIIEINWLFESVERSLARAEINFREQKKSRAYISLRHAKNLTGFLGKSLGDIPDIKLARHLEEFFGYVDVCIETSLRLPIYEDLSEMRSLIKELHGGWLHLVSPIRGASLEEPKVKGNDAFGSLGY
jgi:flagellin-specific chaperone FliS